MDCPNRPGSPFGGRFAPQPRPREAPTTSSSGFRGAGVLVRERFSEHNPGETTGYAVALADSRAHTAAGTPVWYGGGKLAADLTLPKLRGF
jgi:hypothetical protein